MVKTNGGQPCFQGCDGRVFLQDRAGKASIWFPSRVLNFFLELGETVVLPGPEEGFKSSFMKSWRSIIIFARRWRRTPPKPVFEHKYHRQRDSINPGGARFQSAPFSSMSSYCVTAAISLRFSSVIVISRVSSSA